MATYFDEIWDPAEEPRKAGVSDDDIAEWEARNGVKLPESLAAALRRQNGGLVRYGSVRLNPLDEITRPDGGLLGWVAPDRTEVPDRNLLFTFAHDEEEPVYVLNYNTKGRSGEPSVCALQSASSYFRLAANTTAEFLSALIAVSPTPAVDWTETGRLDVVLLQDKVNVSVLQTEIVLGRLGGALVLYTHDVDPWNEGYTKTTIPEPLNPWFAFVFLYPPFINMPYFLHLSPRDPTGVISVKSMRTSDGNWKSTVDIGVPVHVDVLCNSMSRLRALRRELLGKGAAAMSGLVLFASLGIIAALGVLAYLYR